MNEAEIVRCRVRAEDVINGFSCVKITHAKDVIRLANALLAANQRIDSLLARPDKTGFDSFFSDLMNGKKHDQI